VEKTPFFKRVLKFFIKIILIFLFIIYLSFTIQGSFDWAKRVWFRQDPISELAYHIDRYRAENNIEGALFYIRARQTEEQPQIIETLLSNAPKYEPYFYFELARLFEKDEQLEDTFFWMSLGQFRLRYDALRCGEKEGVKLEKFFNFLQTSNSLETYIQEKNLSQQKAMIKRVLDWDEANPPIAKPDYFCKLILKIYPNAVHYNVPEKNWGVIYRNLRFVTKLFLSKNKPDFRSDTQPQGQ